MDDVSRHPVYRIQTHLTPSIGRNKHLMKRRMDLIIHSARAADRNDAVADDPTSHREARAPARERRTTRHRSSSPMSSALAFASSASIAGAAGRTRRNLVDHQRSRSSSVSSSSASRKATRGPVRVVAGNEYENGLFAPIVRVARDVIGVKRFNQIRGKAIALHSQVIGDFCEEFGCDSKVKQTLIRTAKKNGGLLGFLA